MKLWRLLLPAAAGVLVLAACGDAGPDTTVVDPQADMGDMDMEEGDHSHEDDGANAVEWDGGAPPVLEVTVTGDVDSGWDITATVAGFEFSDPSETEHVPGRGHTHVFLDGQLVVMSYEPVVHVAELDPGPHDARVTLSRNDHLDYAIDGEVISDTETFEVPGEVSPPDVLVEVSYAAGEVSGTDARVPVALGDVVEIIVHSDVHEEVHVHGYDLLRDVTPSQPALIRFAAGVPGIFEIELEGSGTLLFELEVR